MATAELVVNRADVFPTGTKVKAFTLPAMLPGDFMRRLQQSGVPNPGSAPWSLTEFGEFTTAANGKTTVTSAVVGQPYLLAAEVEGEWRYIRARATVAVEVDE